MIKNWKRLIAGLAMGFALTGSGLAAWQEGVKLPELQEAGLRGAIPETEGKVVLVDFWASWCPPCKASFPAMGELYEKYKDEGFEVIAISLDMNEAAMERFLERANPPFATVWDAEQKVAQAAGVQVMPTSYLVDKHGTIQFMHRGWSGRKSAFELEARITELLEE